MLAARLSSHLAWVLSLGLLGACTNSKPPEAPRKAAEGDAAQQEPENESEKGSPSAGGADESVSPDQIAEAGLSSDKYKEGRIFVNGWDGKADQPESKKKWILANLSSVPVPPSAGSGSGSGTGSEATPTTATPADATPAGSTSADATPSTETPGAAGTGTTSTPAPADTQTAVP